MEWLRWYHGCVTDPKFPLIARRSGQNVAAVLAMWAALLERASMSDVRGSIDGFDCESFDALLGLEDGACQAILAAFEAKGMIIDGYISKWRERQPTRERDDNNSTDRVRKFRKRQKALQNQESNDCNASETPCNATEHHETPRREEIREEKRDQDPPHTPPQAGGEGEDNPPVESGRKLRQHFTPPVPDEVDAYCRQRDNGIDGQEFCDFYASKGWMVGKNRMKDWKAAVRTWENERRKRAAERNAGEKAWWEVNAL